MCMINVLKTIIVVLDAYRVEILFTFMEQWDQQNIYCNIYRAVLDIHQFILMHHMLMLLVYDYTSAGLQIQKAAGLSVYFYSTAF